MIDTKDSIPALLPPNKWEKIIRSVGYVSLGVAGLFALFNPPQSIKQTEDVVLLSLAVVTGIFLSTAFVAAGATLKGWYRVEYVPLPLLILGSLLYVVAVVRYSFDAGSGSLFTAAVAFSFACKMGTRLAGLHRLINAHKKITIQRRGYRGGGTNNGS